MWLVYGNNYTDRKVSGCEGVNLSQHAHYMLAWIFFKGSGIRIDDNESQTRSQTPGGESGNEKC